MWHVICVLCACQGGIRQQQLLICICKPYAGQGVIHHSVHFGRQEIHIGIGASQMQGGGNVQGTHEALDESARRELLRKETPEEVAAPPGI